jgi:ribosomal protein S18 acetylase RimI-like enzyme
MPDLQSLSGGVVLHPLSREHWRLLRDARLAALQESPKAFLATFEQETAYAEERWRTEFTRGDWYVGYLGDRPVSMAGATRQDDTPPDECYLEYIWVAPGYRHNGVATDMLKSVHDRLRESGVRRANLWVLDNNDPALHLYLSLGYGRIGDGKPLKAIPGRCEQLMSLALG